MAAPTAQDESYEEEHVHAVYEQIASHFSSTRYKPWPIIERFLKDLPDYSVGLDVGCGNGKYLAVNPNVFIIGSDRSTNLTQIASQHRPHSAVVADILDLPHATGTAGTANPTSGPGGGVGFDFAISIAVVHHLSTPARRVEAIRSILETLNPKGGRALVYVWALEQEGSRRGWKEGGEQDVMVPWVMKGPKKRKEKKKGVSEWVEGEGPGEAVEEVGGDRTFHRFYHLYRKGELEEDLEAAGGVVVEAGYEKDNWWAIARRANGS